MSENLERKFRELVSHYSHDERLGSELWTELHSQYHAENRFYHNLTHLENMIDELEVVRDEITDFDALLFSVFYHDFIYSPTSNNNESKSAEIAENRLDRLNFPAERIVKVFRQILATKKHKESQEADTNYLLDADLAVLGQDWEIYEVYRSHIRLEYSVYPDFLYQRGRKKVLKQFLCQKEIYKTKHFREKYEGRARENILKELLLR